MNDGVRLSDDGVWTDTAYEGGATAKIGFGSDAYFDALQTEYLAVELAADEERPQRLYRLDPRSAVAQ